MTAKYIFVLCFAKFFSFEPDCQILYFCSMFGQTYKIWIRLPNIFFSFIVWLNLIDVNLTAKCNFLFDVKNYQLLKQLKLYIFYTSNVLMWNLKTETKFLLGKKQLSKQKNRIIINNKIIFRYAHNSNIKH